MLLGLNSIANVPFLQNTTLNNWKYSSKVSITDLILYNLYVQSAISKKMPNKTMVPFL